jgi:hypothetical protein
MQSLGKDPAVLLAPGDAEGEVDLDAPEAEIARRSSA